MKKEDVLKMSRKENEGKHDEREMAAYSAACKVGFLVGGILCAVLIFVAEVILQVREIGMVAWMIYAAMYGSNSIILYTQLRKRTHLVCGIVALIVAVAFTVLLCVVTLG